MQSLGPFPRKRACESRADAFPARVVKVGGSLLEHESLQVDLTRWLCQQPPMSNVLLAGGGGLVNAIRRIDEKQKLAEAVCHWMCVSAMSLTSRILLEKLPQAHHLKSWPALCERLATQEKSLTVFDAQQFLQEEEPQAPPAPLPWDWTVTSDSIAARLAEALGASECVLLKSADPPPGDWRDLASQNYVDSHLPVVAGRYSRIRCVNLRGETSHGCDRGPLFELPE